MGLCPQPSVTAAVIRTEEETPGESLMKVEADFGVTHLQSTDGWPPPGDKKRLGKNLP